MVIINPATQVKTHIGKIIIVKKTKRKILINRFIGTNIEIIFVNVIFFLSILFKQGFLPSFCRFLFH